MIANALSICLSFDHLSSVMCIGIVCVCVSMLCMYKLFDMAKVYWVWHRKVSKTRITASPLVFMPFDMNAMTEWTERASDGSGKLGCAPKQGKKKKDRDGNGGGGREKEHKRECEIGAAYRVSSYAQLGYKPRRNRKRMLHTMICVCKHILKNVTKYVESGFCHFLVVIRVNRWNM